MKRAGRLRANTATTGSTKTKKADGSISTGYSRLPRHYDTGPHPVRLNEVASPGDLLEARVGEDLWDQLIPVC
jgi:hypothetical protein